MWGGGLLKSFLLFVASSLIEATPTIDYSLSYVSTGTSDSSSLVFSTALQNTTSIISHSLVPSTCRSNCSTHLECLGYVAFRGSHCVTLRDLGEPVPTNLTTLSFTKTTSYDLRDKHSIQGFFWYSNAEYAQGTNHSVYVDLNHNGAHDLGEPINTTVNNNFLITDIPEGNYLVREIQDDTCTQLWPGVWGDNEIVAEGAQETFVDSVVQYYHDGHPTSIQFYGGIINDLSTNQFTFESDAPSDYLLGNTPNQFLSFLPNYGIVLAFLDEVITNGDGNDLIIQTFGESSTDAIVSISQNNLDWFEIGTLTNEKNEFEIGNFTEHVAYVKLDFFGNDAEDLRNITFIKGVTIEDAYRPPYAVYVSVPQDDLILFVKDCNYYYSCYTYCVYTRVTFDTIDSCMVGCDLWEKTGTCDCANYNETGVDVPFYGTNYKQNECMDGCEYKIQHEVYPDYRLKMHASGRPTQITSSINCDEYDVTGLSPNGCILDAIDSCNRQPSCEAISLDDHVHGYLYNDYHFVNEKNSYFLVKNSDDRNHSLVRYTTPTTTPTTSQTTTVSSSQTTTATSSQTTTATSSQTTTATSSQTTTDTSSQTTTDTSSQTTTATSSQTSTETSTPTRTFLLEQSSNTTVRDSLLITFAILLAILVGGLLIHKYRKGLAKKRQEAANDHNHIPELAPDHAPYTNPIYDSSVDAHPSSPTHNTFISNGNPSPGYMDVMPDYVEEAPPISPQYMDVVSVETETNV